MLGRARVSVRAALPEGLQVYLVGGAVRDILLQRETHDLDFTLERGAIKLARRLADALGAGFFPLDSDRDTGRSKGFGFVEMGSDDEARAAIAGANGQDVNGRQIKVNEAMDKPRRDDRY